MSGKPQPALRIKRQRVCEVCHKAFLTRRPRAKGRFCSRRCHADSMRTRPRNDPRPCVCCGTTFKPSRKMGHARFCSKRCEWLTLKGPEYNARVARQSVTRRADAQRGRGNGKAYRKRGGRHEHRVVAEQKIGRPLTFQDVVHHIDGNKLNNDPANLVVITRREHMAEHDIWRKRWRK